MWKGVLCCMFLRQIVHQHANLLFQIAIENIDYLSIIVAPNVKKGDNRCNLLPVWKQWIREELCTLRNQSRFSVHYIFM